jgi:hypothetical protein
MASLKWKAATGLQKFVPVSKAFVKPISPSNYFKVIIKIKYKED